MYLQTHVFVHDSDTAILSIIMPSVIEAETCQCKAYSNGARVTSGVTWSIISGSDYATINSSNSDPDKIKDPNPPLGMYKPNYKYFERNCRDIYIKRHPVINPHSKIKKIMYPCSR